MTLDQLELGKQAYIVRIKGSSELRKRLVGMGFVLGRKVKVVRKAPLQDPIEFLILNYHVSLRKKEAQLIEVYTDEEIITKYAQEWQQVAQRPILMDTFFERKVQERTKTITVALIGNPNSGKTTLFNFLTHSFGHVGNFAGITVDVKKASIDYHGYHFELIDLPGLYSLTAFSPEEEFVLDYLMEETPDYIINVVDVNALERSLFLTTQLIELDIPFVIALNMWDEFTKKGHKLDVNFLSTLLGIPIVPTIAPKKKGLEKLFQTILDVHNQSKLCKRISLPYPLEIEESIKEIKNNLENDPQIPHISSQFLAIKLLEKDPYVQAKVPSQILKKVQEKIQLIEKTYNNTIDIIIANVRCGFVQGALKETLQLNEKIFQKKTTTEKIDDVVTHKIWGYVIFSFIIWFMFFSTFKIGNIFQEYIERLVEITKQILDASLPASMLKSLIIDGILQGIGGIIIFFPNILILYFFIALIEDSGYLARIAFIMDKIMHKIGLHGKSFIPMMMGFGCNVPAIAATRILNNPSDRIITILINPFFSCSARLPVYVLIISAIFPAYGNWILFAIYMSGILMAIVFSILFRKIFFSKKSAPFVMELPPYRMPTLRALSRHMWFRSSQFLKKMGGVILIASIILWFLNYFPLHRKPSPAIQQEMQILLNKYPSLKTNISNIHAFPQQNSIPQEFESLLVKYNEEIAKQSYLARIGKWLEPVFKPMEFNWQITTSLLAGLAGKEIVVSTLAINTGTQNKDSFLTSIQKLFSIPSALAFLVFILLYSPCIGVLTAISKETGKMSWSVFSFAYSTLLAYVMALIIFNIASMVI